MLLFHVNFSWECFERVLEKYTVKLIPKLTSLKDLVIANFTFTKFHILSYRFIESVSLLNLSSSNAINKSSCLPFKGKRLFGSFMIFVNYRLNMMQLLSKEIFFLMNFDIYFFRLSLPYHEILIFHWTKLCFNNFD